MRSDGSNVIHLNIVTQQEQDYFDIAVQLSEARVRFSQEFQRSRMQKGVTDEQARQAAIEITGDEITAITAALKVAEVRLEQ